eukprot:5337839-Amphidinium_carterae.1
MDNGYPKCTQRPAQNQTTQIPSRDSSQDSIPDPHTTIPYASLLHLYGNLELEGNIRHISNKSCYIEVANYAEQQVQTVPERLTVMRVRGHFDRNALGLVGLSSYPTPSSQSGFAVPHQEITIWHSVTPAGTRSHSMKGSSCPEPCKSEILPFRPAVHLRFPQESTRF